jgi:hypothetical protein
MLTYVEMARDLANLGMVADRPVLTESAFDFLDADAAYQAKKSKANERKAHKAAMILRVLYNQNFVQIVKARSA